jgi:hypothetical protein
MANPDYIICGIIQLAIGMVCDLDARQRLAVFQPEWLINMKFLHAPDSEF